MGVVAVLASFGLASSAAAGPGVIAARRAEAFDAPSESARVVSELGHGAAVLVLDEDGHTGAVQHRPGWLAIRLPGSGRIGYVHADAIELTAASGIVDPSCCEPASVPMPSAPPARPAPLARSAPPDQPAPLARSASPAAPDPEPWAEPTSEPVSVSAGTPLMAGGFLPLQLARFVVGVGSGAAWLREELADQYRIGSSGPTLNATARLIIYDVFTISTAAGAVLPADNGSFRQQVVPEQGGGSPTNAGSSLGVWRYSVAVGLRTPFWALSSIGTGWFAGALYADYGTASFGGSRSISDCIDCRRDDLELPGGTFWRVGVDLVAPVQSSSRGYGFTVAYQRYQAGAGMTQELQVGLGIWMQ